jgi:hypothetical protein
VSQTVESLGFNPANPRPHNKGLQPRRTPRTRERIERERTTPAFVSRHGFSRAERQPRRRRFPAAAGCRRKREAPGADSPNFPFREPGETRPPETRGFSPGALQPPEHESKESAPHPFLYRGTKADGTGRRRSPNLQSLIPRDFPRSRKIVKPRTSSPKEDYILDTRNHLLYLLLSGFRIGFGDQLFHMPNHFGMKEML